MKILITLPSFCARNALSEVHTQRDSTSVALGFLVKLWVCMSDSVILEFVFMTDRHHSDRVRVDSFTSIFNKHAFADDLHPQKRKVSCSVSAQNLETREEGQHKCSLMICVL